MSLVLNIVGFGVYLRHLNYVEPVIDYMDLYKESGLESSLVVW
jgi:hypothetical protein